MHHPNASHEHCWELIPWTVNGRASELQQQAVLAHAEHCSECRQELARHRALHSHMRGADEAIAAPDASWQKLLAGIEAQPAPPRSVADRIRRPWLIAALWVQLVAIAALAGALFHSTRIREPAYLTLSSPSAAELRGDVRIVFAPDASLGRVNQLLRETGGEIIAGPSEAGVYTISLPGQADVQPVLTALRQHPEVLFAEPGQGTAGTSR